MDVCIPMEDLLDFSNDDLFSSSSTPPPPPPPHHHHHIPSNPPPSPPTLSHHLPIPESPSPPLFLEWHADDVAHLEWLSQFVEDSFLDFPADSLAETSFSAAANPASASASSRNGKSESTLPSEQGTRRCTHCASVKTPQWRTGPLGPKTLCNACGVRYKSGRLVPEYRPAASPTFMLTQHSNSHRKVLELRRQKELLREAMEEE